MTKHKENDNTNLDETLGRTGQYLVDNKKKISTITGAVLFIIIAFIAYNRFYAKPFQEESVTKGWEAEHYMEMDSLNWAINGNINAGMNGDPADGRYGFRYMAENYEGTKGGMRARYNLGIALLNNGQFQEAIDQLEDVNFEEDEVMLTAFKFGAMGDCFWEIGAQEKAIEFYNKAVGVAENILANPYFLKKAGLVAEELGKYKEANGYYSQIKEKYPDSMEARDIDKYIAFTENL